MRALRAARRASVLAFACCPPHLEQDTLDALNAVDAL
jgi:hypothetical protein